MKKMLLIYNPHAGKALFRPKLADIVEHYTAQGYAVTVHPTQQKSDTTKIILAEGERFDMIVCSGGDGTLNEAVNAMVLLENAPTLGYIPTGTTNDFASSLGISKNILEAAQVVTQGMPFTCDAGRFNDEAFTYIAAFGLFTDVAYETSQQFKNTFGRMAYLLEGTKRLGSIKSYEMELNIDGEQVEGEFIYGMITNSTSVGGLKNFAGTHPHLDDGLLEVVLVRPPQNPLDLHELLQAILNEQMHSRFMFCTSARHITVKSKTPVDWTLDGEYGGTETAVCIQNLQNAFTIMVPKQLPATSSIS